MNSKYLIGGVATVAIGLAAWLVLNQPNGTPPPAKVLLPSNPPSKAPQATLLPTLAPASSPTSQPTIQPSVPPEKDPELVRAIAIAEPHAREAAAIPPQIVPSAKIEGDKIVVTWLVPPQDLVLHGEFYAQVYVSRTDGSVLLVVGPSD